ncbi:MAG: response regulator [Lachnospiraceae bacterium]|nr:response regulator [Lachnospiraceae bacterium]
MIEIAVCDDDANDLKQEVNILHEIFTTQKINYNMKTFLSANEMLDNIKKIDIGILDIAMNDLNGIKLGRKLREKFPNVKLIYITSYEEFCMEAINNAHAFSFLSKPLDKCKMKKQILELFNGIPNNAVEKEFYRVTDSRQKEYASIKLKLEDILYFEYIKRQRKAAIVLENETYECECVFEKLVEELKQYDFAVNCRGNLVNLSRIKKIKGFSIYLDNGKELQIAQKRIVDFRLSMNEFLQRNSL